jgi:YebC/PmpR family DNA-binding regulatory protein
MSGHSKWSTIKRKKGAADAKRGAAFTKLANALTIAAKEGGGDPTMNFSLRLAMDRARAANMPSANIDRAIKRGTGELAGAKAPEQVTYEGYGPGGVALLVECLTDNRNRTVSDVRSTITKRGGSLGETGSVGYLFEKRGVLTVPRAGNDADEVMLTAIEAGASDVSEEAEIIAVETPKASFKTVKDALEGAGFAVDAAALENVATAHVPVTDAGIAGKVVDLMGELEDLDDVISVSTNADIDPELVSDKL